MLFICELDMLEGYSRPEYDCAIIKASSHEEAYQKAHRAFQESPGIDAVYLFEVQPEQRSRIPPDLIDKRMTESVAENLGIRSDFLLSDAARSLLAKFPGPVTLQPPKKILAILFIVGIMIAAIGVLPALLLEPKGGWDLELYLAVGFFIAVGVLFMAGSVVAIIKVRMTLDATGFERLSGVASERRHWKDVSFFHPVKVGLLPVVAYVDSTRHGIWAERMLPDQFSFGFTPDELAAVINRWRRRALSQNR